MRNQEISICLAVASDTVTYVELNLCYGVGCVQKVCRCLVNGGPLSIGDIGRLAEVNPLEVENSIVVLLQHNCVQGFKAQQQEDGSAGKNPSQSSPVLNSSVVRHWCQFGVTTRWEHVCNYSILSAFLIWIDCLQAPSRHCLRRCPHPTLLFVTTSFIACDSQSLWQWCATILARR